MEKGEGKECLNWYGDSDSDDSIVVTISQMQDEASKLQSTAAEIREELSGLLATLDDIEQRSTPQKRKKISAKAKPESGDAIRTELPLLGTAHAASLKPVDGGTDLNESDDRYRDVTTTALAEPPPLGSSGDTATSTVVDSKPFDARELLDSLLDAVMERQSGAGDSLDAHPQHRSSTKEEFQEVPKGCIGAEGQLTAGDPDAVALTRGSDSDDGDVVVGPTSWDVVERRRLRRSRKPASDGSRSSRDPSSSTLEDAFHDAEAAVEGAGADIALIDGSDCATYHFE